MDAPRRKHVEIEPAFYSDTGAAQEKLQNCSDEWRGVYGLTKLLRSHTMPRVVLRFLHAD